jgi:uncharacterized protein DUF732
VTGKGRGFAVAMATIALAAAPAARAEPGPGSGETFFVDYLTRVFNPPTTEAAARAIIPLAQQVCDAKEQGQSDLQASSVVLAGNGVERLGLAGDSGSGDEVTAINIVDAATLAYCPQYNSSLNGRVIGGDVE